MAPLRTLAALFLAGTASAFAPVSNVANRVAVPSSTSQNLLNPAVYEDAVADWEKQFPAFAKWGWGPTVQAEKWNGRHAMFGWFFICATAYCKGHGLIPDADVPLDFKEWGTLATISGTSTITNGRAIILVANAHAFAISLMAAMAPLPFSDPLFSYEGSQKEGYGYMPALKFGLTEETEMIHGRFAMVGIFALLMTTAITGKDMVDIVNEWVGGAYY